MSAGTKNSNALPAGVLATTRRASGEPDFLTKARMEAWSIYERLPLPDRVAHLWRYTDPAGFEPNEGVLSEELAFEEKGTLSSDYTRLLDAKELTGGAICQPGVGTKVFLDTEASDKGVVLCDLRTVEGQTADVVKEKLGTVVAPSHGKFEALASAAWQYGFLVYVPQNVELEKPIHILNAWTQDAAWSGFRLLVILEQGARLKLVEEHLSSKKGGGPALVYGLSEAEVGAAGNLQHVTVQRFGRDTTAHITQRTNVGADASTNPILVSLGGRSVKMDLGTRLKGKGSETNLLAFAFGREKQRFDHHTVHDHRVGHTYSNLEMRVVLNDKARSAYTGLIDIVPDAPYSEAYQENRNLLLSEHARAETIPELEIETDEVKCTHGATVGPLDPEQIFYLESRGIPKNEARRMAVGGFLEPTLLKVPEEMRERLRKTINERLQHL